MNYDTYHIPNNFTDAGRIMGLFEIRNLIEAVVVVVPILYILIFLIPMALTPKIIVTISVTIPIGGFTLMGVSDDSLSRWLSTWWRWLLHRRRMFYRGEVN